MTPKLFKYILPAVVIFLLAAPLWAQRPDTGIADREIQRQQELERQRRQEFEDRAPDIHFKTDAEPDSALIYPEAESPCMVINKVELVGKDAHKFKWALKEADSALGRCLGAQSINVLMSRIQNQIIKKGYITTRIVAAPQDLATGKLELTVIVGRISGVRLSEGSGRHIILETTMPISKGDILNIRDIEQGLENLKRVPTVETDIQLAPGGEEGESEVVIAWKQGRPFRLTLSADDSGSKYTGRYQGMATVSLDNMLGFSDLFYATLSGNLESGRKDYGTRGHSFYYSIPWDYWLFSFNTNYYRYHQRVAGYYTDYIYSGQSRNTSLELSRIVHRGAKSKTALSFSGFVHDSRNLVDDVEIEVQRRRMGGWEAGLNHRHYLGALALDLDVRYHRGTGVFDALPAPEEVVGEGTARPEILNLDIRAQYPFKIGNQNLRYIGSWRQQWAFDRLVSRDRLSLGGRYTVRGYDGDMTLSADNGFVFRNELGLALGQTGQELYAGLDFGRVWGPDDRYLLGRSLSGAALGLRGFYKSFNYDVFLAGPVNRPKYFPGDKIITGFNAVWQF